MTVKGMTHEIWPTALIVSMLILIGISGHTVRDVDAALNIHNDLLRPLAATRSPDVDVVTTSYMLDGRDDGWIDELDHLKLIGDDYIQVTDKELGYLASIPSSYDSLFTDTNARSIQIYEGIIYLAYITLSFNPSALHYNLFTSDDGGGSWNMPVEVHSVAGLSEGSAEIYLYQDKIFYLMMMDSNNANLRGAEIKVANYLGWQNLPSAESKIVDTDYPEETKIIGYRDEVLLFEKDNGYGSVGFWRYNNGSWTGRYNMLGSHHMCPIVGDIGDGEMIYLFFTYHQARITSTSNIQAMAEGAGQQW